MPRDKVKFGRHRSIDELANACLDSAGVDEIVSWPHTEPDNLERWLATDRGLVLCKLADDPVGVDMTFTQWRDVGGVGLQIIATATHEPNATLRVTHPDLTFEVPRAIGGDDRWQFVEAVLRETAKAHRK